MMASKTLADFRSKFDRDIVVPGKIKAALATLGKEGPEAWEYEGDFIKRAGVSQTDIGKYREQFAKHIVVAKEVGRSTSGNGRRVWFWSAGVAAKARGE
jgi:hypothetical protein